MLNESILRFFAVSLLKISSSASLLKKETNVLGTKDDSVKDDIIMRLPCPMYTVVLARQVLTQRDGNWLQRVACDDPQVKDSIDAKEGGYLLQMSY